MARSPLELSSLVYIQVCFRGEAPLGTPDQFRKVDVMPSDEYPMGRKGLVISRSWQGMKEHHTRGMLILDADVAIDPIDFGLMYGAITSKPFDIHTGMARLWPKSTGYTQWVWSHRKIGTIYSEWQEHRTDVDTGSFCFTYLPGKLLNKCIEEGMETWVFPNVDQTVYKVARENKIKMHVVEGCLVKHMNY